MQRILVTGFEGFGGRKDNPSAEVATALNGTGFENSIVVSRVLPVTNHDLQSNLIKLLEELKPAVVLCLGLSAGESVVRIERLAANYSRFDIADNAGERYCGCVVADGPAAYETTLPVDAMLAAVNRCGIPARLSNSAGAYLCNALMYHALHYSVTSKADYISGFVHLPYMPSQVCDIMSRENGAIDTSSLSSMSLDDQKRAVIEIIRCIDA